MTIVIMEMISRRVEQAERADTTPMLMETMERATQTAETGRGTWKGGE